MRTPVKETTQHAPSAIRMGAFCLHEPIGRGAMAVVWRGVHEPTGVPIAAKFATPREFDRRQRDLFRSEVRSVAALDHPGIVRIFDQGDVSEAMASASGGRLMAGSPGLAMELADAGTLDDLVRAPWGLDWPKLQEILLAILDALAHAHARGVVHRDLKPSNILRFSDGRLAVADFGLAYALEPELRESGLDLAVGTPRYMAPEQIGAQWRDFGPWTDLYALGCIAHQLVSGRPPFPYDSALAVAKGHMMDLPAPPRRRFAIPDEVDAWIATLLRKSPELRYRRAADAAAALRNMGAVNARVDGDAGSTQPLPALVDYTIDGSAARTMEHAEPLDAVELEEGLSPAVSEAPAVPAQWGETLHPGDRAMLGAGLSLFGIRAIPMVGREAPRRTLWDALREATESNRACGVVVTGAAGIGKTAVARWFSQRCSELGVADVLWLRGGQQRAEPLASMVCEALNLQGLERDAARERLGVWATRRGASNEVRDALERLVAPSHDEPIGPGEKIRCAASFLDLAASERTNVLVLDDANECPAALDFAVHLLTRDASARLVVLVLARSSGLAEVEESAAAIEALSRLEGVATRRLGELEDPERRALARRLLCLEPGLAAHLEARSEGNPSYLVQLVGDLVARGALRLGARGFETEEGVELGLPGELEELWQGRIDRILAAQPREAGVALELAATLGQVVSRQEWRGACEGAGVSVPEALVEALLEEALAFEEREGEWCFAHPAMREAIAVRAQTAGRWRAHHDVCAAMLESDPTTGVPGRAERIARHRLAGGHRASAVEPLLAAAQERREASDYARAEALLRQRDELLSELGDHDERTPGILLRARIALHLGDLERVEEHARSVESLGSLSPNDRSEALRFFGDAARRRGDLDAAARAYGEAIALRSRVSNPHGVAASSWGLGDVERQLGSLDRARELFRQANALYRVIGDQHGVADHLIGEADVARQSGDFDGARNYYERARAMFERLRNRYGVARAENGIAECERYDGAYEAALRRYERAERTLLELDSIEAVFPHLNRALVHLARADVARAEAGFEQARAQLVELGWGGLLPCVHAGCMAVAAAHGDARGFDEARVDLLESLAGGVRELDVAVACQNAGDLGRAAGATTLARAAYELAAEHYGALELGARRRKVRRALRSL